MHKLKQFIARNFENFAYFYKYLRHKIFISVGISIIVGLLDGLGLTMFLPLLQMVSNSSQVNSDDLGKMGFIIDFLNNSGIGVNLVSILLFMVIFFLLKGIAKFGNAAYQVVLQQHFIRKVRMNLLTDFNQLQFKHYVTTDVGRIQNTMTGEVDRVTRAFMNYFRTAEQAVLVAVYIGFAFFVDARFALLVSFGGWLTNFLYTMLYKKTKSASVKFTEDSHNYQGQIIQHVANFKYLKATGLLNAYADKLRDTINKIEITRKSIGIIGAILLAVREPILIVVVAAVILIQTELLNSPLGPILISLLFFYRALTSLLNVQNSWNRYLEVSGSMANIQDFNEELRNNKEEPKKKPFSRFKDSIILRNVSFGYNGTQVLKDINLTIEKNTAIAFVGESGSGKTTLVNLLAALMPIDKGEMFIDSFSSKELNPLSYQCRIGYITQEAVIFNDTIYNNVTFWAKPTSENYERFKMALNKAAIYDFVMNLPEQEKTILGNSGVNLSGGQKQRISIARELYKDTDILIMDEATSALDTETEKVIQESIESLKGQYTMLIVAHRLSTIKNVDKIILMKDGCIKSTGSYSELMQKNNGFKKMVELQEL